MNQREAIGQAVLDAVEGLEGGVWLDVGIEIVCSQDFREALKDSYGASMFGPYDELSDTALGQLLDFAADLEDKADVKGCGASLMRAASRRLQNRTQEEDHE